MEHRVRINILSSAIVVAIAVAASIITSVVVASRAYESRAKAALSREQTITVKGSSRQRIKSDLAVWSITVRGEADTLPKSFAQLESGLQRVQGLLETLGFRPGDVVLSAIDTSTHYQRDGKGNDTRTITGYTLARTLTITTPDVARVDTSASKVTELLKDGILVETGAPAFYYSKLPDLRVAILGEASKDARTRADEVARAAGSKVGEVRSANMGPLQVVRPNSTDVSGSGAYDTHTIDKDVYAVVTLTFAVAAD